LLIDGGSAVVYVELCHSLYYVIFTLFDIIEIPIDRVAPVGLEDACIGIESIPLKLKGDDLF
jgi:hypothetical protein